MSKYQKANPRKKNGELYSDFLVFFRAFINELWLTERKKERRTKIHGDFCSGISQLHERLGEL